MSESGPASQPASVSRPRLRDRLRASIRRRSVAQPGKDRGLRIRGEHVVVAYAVVAVVGLIVLRALVDSLDFLGVGWILVLAMLPGQPRSRHRNERTAL